MPEFALLEAGAIALKGKSRPAKLFALIGDETLAETDDWHTLQERHAALLKAIAQENGAETETLMRRCLEVAPDGLDYFYARLAETGKARLAAE